MLQILLVRHGKPAFDDWTPVAGAAFATWVRGYDEAPIDVTVPPPPRLRAQALAMGCVATSTLRRACESAALLAADRAFVCEPIFAEAGLPSSIHLTLALAPRHWAFLLRVAWFCGLSHRAESLRDARTRAHRAAERARFAGWAGTALPQAPPFGQSSRCSARPNKRLKLAGARVGRIALPRQQGFLSATPPPCARGYCARSLSAIR